MLFEKKIERAMKWLKEKNDSETQTNILDENVEELEDGLEKQYSDKPLERKIYDESFVPDEDLEKKDLLAIMISALLVISPVVIIILGMYVLVAYWMFG